MKSIKFWSINLFAVMTLPMILACANDNDDKSEVLNKLDKYISNIEYFDARDSDNYYYNFQYATNGKLLNINWNYVSNRGSSNHGSYPYEYLDNMIVMHPYYNDDIKYTLLNNRLVSIEDKYNGQNISYSYDNNNLLSCLIRSKSNNPITISYTWSNGNITKMEFDGGKTYDIEYTSYPWPKNYIMPFDYLSVFYDSFWLPSIIMSMGYCGNHPKNLPKKFGDKEYNYTLEEGYPVIIKAGDNVFKYTWN